MCMASPSTVRMVIIHMNPLMFDAILGTDVGDLYDHEQKHFLLCKCLACLSENIFSIEHTIHFPFVFF